jgi:hypothetical protein
MEVNLEGDVRDIELMEGDLERMFAFIKRA